VSCRFNIKIASQFVLTSSLGGLAIAVPGEVSGLYAAWEMFGRVPWADLVQPTIDLCENGFYVEAALMRSITQNEALIRADPNLSYVICLFLLWWFGCTLYSMTSWMEIV
jgi:gamma-glutamyltranspeptidase